MVARHDDKVAIAMIYGGIPQEKADMTFFYRRPSWGIAHHVRSERSHESAFFEADSQHIESFAIQVPDQT